MDPAAYQKVTPEPDITPGLASRLLWDLKSAFNYTFCLENKSIFCLPSSPLLFLQWRPDPENRVNIPIQSLAFFRRSALGTESILFLFLPSFFLVLQDISSIGLSFYILSIYIYILSWSPSKLQPLSKGRRRIIKGMHPTPFIHAFLSSNMGYRHISATPYHPKQIRNATLIHQGMFHLS